ncbi:MAG: IS1595 family transposase [Stellaceae bacterium]
MADLQNPIFQDEEAARAALEAVIWPRGPVCPHCGSVERIAKVEGKKHRPGLYYCNECKGTFTVTVGTAFERSKIPLSKWWLASHLMGSSKKGVSAHQLHRSLGVTYKTAWFMAHRLREAMRVNNPDPIGGQNKVVEADETYMGGKDKNKHANKRLRGRWMIERPAVVSLVERGGEVRSSHIADVGANTLGKVLHKNIDSRTYLMTDELAAYQPIGKGFAGHDTVHHTAGQYVKRGGFTHTNTVENFFSIMKRGVYGTYHHISQQHLMRYLAEFDFRFNNRSALGVSDAERAVKLVKGISGKRLTYRRTSEGRASL